MNHADIKATLKNVIEKCDIIYSNEFYGNCVISKESLLIAFSEFFFESLSKDGRKTGIIMHIDSICFNILAVVFSAIVNILNSDIDTTDVIESLREGDIVLLGNEKYRFIGIEKGKFNKPSEEYIKLMKDNNKQAKNNFTFLPKPSWSKISPYYGDSDSLDNRGLRKYNENLNEFFAEVMSLNPSELPNVFSVSSVILTEREQADDIVKNVSFRFNGKTISLLDLVTAAYYSENNRYDYSGNRSKSDPILKFAGKIDVAADLVRDKSGNKNTGLIILGNTAYERSINELDSVFNRRSLDYSYIVVPMRDDFDNMINMIKEEYNPDIFACTEDFLASQPLEKVENNYLTRMLERKTDVLSARNIRNISAECNGNVEFRKFKMTLKQINNCGYNSEIIDDFIMSSYSLWNLFQYAPFGMNFFEKLIENNVINYFSPAERLEELNESINSFPSTIKSEAKYIIDQLFAAYNAVFECSGKEKELRKIISEYNTKKVAIVVPKGFYKTALLSHKMLSHISPLGCVDIFTSNNFISDKIYDIVVTLGNYAGKKFNIYYCASSKNIAVLLYDYEQNLFNFKAKEFARTRRNMNKKSLLRFEYNDEIQDNTEEDIETEKLSAIESELTERINEIALYTATSYLSHQTQNNGQLTNVVKAAVFEDGECAFFTKMYKAYCYDPNNNTLREVAVNDLEIGDQIIFTKNNAETTDFIDGLIRELIYKDSGIDERIKYAYERSKIWKQELRNYMIVNNLKPSEVADRLTKCGATVQEITIRGWLDPDSHTVKPNDMNNIVAIGRLVDDEDIINNPNEYFDICNVIYELRSKIREEIKIAIAAHFGCKTHNAYSYLKNIQDELDNMYDVMRIETITDIEEEISAASANRPLSL